ncbi:hypothetical protein [Pseudomonas sp. BJa3]|uniref:hypothetical protein n=1 Tax=Pseudomonas sp. BJa3 TaxID=2986525 RepID=UPI002265BA80|nr:hypothetical protein [Pseudomonas sp. BJa3]MCX5508368.1 hypothetical protein [Pseudomonas sp. BJa3]
MARSRSQYETTLRLYQAQAEMDYILDVFGDSLAKEHKLPNDLYGMEAVDFYLMQKHNWTAAQLNQMTREQKRFALSSELAGFILPKNAHFEL